jgi:ubiquitin-protein ligase
MSEVLRKRLTDEFRMIHTECRQGLLGFTAAPRTGNLKIWDAVIYGPEGSDWDGATLKTEIQFPDNYPNSPPDIYIRTRNMFHPNVSTSTGRFCLYMFYDGQWTSQNNIISALMTIQAVLVTPNPDSPYNGDAAGLWRNNRAEYRRRVRLSVESSWDDD